MFHTRYRKYKERIATLQAAVHDFESQAAHCAAEMSAAQADLVHTSRQRDRMATELAQIKIALNEVAVYEGIVEVSPVALLVSELVRDHEELESRIDSVISLLKGAKEAANVTDEPTPLIDEVARLLSGGERVPDDPSSLSDLA